MDDDNSIEVKCENLMSVVVETRKRFGKLAKEYEHKSSVMENKILDLKIQTISNYRFKSKYTIPECSTVESEKLDNFMKEFLERMHRIENLKLRIKNTQKIVLQLKNDDVAKALKKPLTTEAILSGAKEKYSA